MGVAQRKAAYERRERTRELRELHGCTFAPQISRQPQKKPRQPVAERLFEGVSK